ncbi:MAG: HD domain-containing protein [Phycisphaeraceae bacterium]|nr:HD domain-containing protein [Phycisphaeraceae bacterium]
MLRVSIREAVPGMRLAMPVYHPRRGGPVLLKSGVALDDRLIQRLREIELREIWIHYPGMGFMGQFVSPAILQARAELGHQVLTALDCVAANAEAKLDYAAYKRAIVGLVEQLLRAPAAAYYVEELSMPDTPHGRHANAVCFLSLVMGLKLGDYLIAERSRLHASHAKDVTSLGVGAMLHDVGMLRLPVPTLQKWNREHDETDPHWQRHVKLGFDMVRNGIDPSAAAVVLHHHQAFDGSGFPRRKLLGGGSAPLAGQEIHVFSRIVALADAFDRLRDSGDAPGADSMPQKKRPTVSALRELVLGDSAAKFDPMAIRALVASVPAYSPGSLVTLNTGVQAVVCNWRTDDPCRPRVLPIQDLSQAIDADEPRTAVLDSTIEPPGIIDLASTPDAYIAQAEGFDVSDENFLLPYAGAYDLRKADKERINRAETLGTSQL